MKRTTIIRFKDKIRKEKLLTLREFVKMDRLKPGQNILIGEVDLEKGTSCNTESFWVGDATPFHEPSSNDGGFGWNFDNQVMKKYVLEVNEY